MSDQSPSRHSLVGRLLMVISVAIPGIVILAAVVDPSLGWVGPGRDGPLLRVLLGGVGVLLCAGSLGFLSHRPWAWWIAVVWGAVSFVEVARFFFASPAIVPILFPQIVAVGFMVYVWRRRTDFGVARGAPQS